MTKITTAAGTSARAGNWSANLARLAGAARVDITPALGVALMGYGARVGRADSVADRLHARALALDDGPGRSLIAVSADLCLMAPEQARSIRERITAATGVAAARVLVACTHTHSGPDTGLSELLAGKPVPDWVPAVFDGIAGAAVEAWQRREPAKLGWARAEARIGRNRRVAEAPIDPAVDVLRVDARSGRPIAVLFRHSCHGTVRGHDNLAISADWPGTAAAAIESATGAVAPFLLGSHADVDPRTRGLMDPAIPGQSVGLGPEAVRVLGREVADAVLESLGKAEPEADDDMELGAGTRSVRLPIHLGDRTPEAARAELAQRKTEIAGLLGKTPESLPRLGELFDLASAATRDLPAAEARHRIAQVRLYIRDKTSSFFVGGRRELDVEVQVLRIGRAVLLGLPLEPTTAVGLDWRHRIGPGGIGAVIGIANGWLRYLPHATDLAHPRAQQHYEVLQSLLAPGACEALLDAGESLARELAEV
ncbi:MAG: neutral/alkaline non-lysosomal ceramidase N-terminal domain-containing protein [Myxococcota bacterium]